MYIASGLLKLSFGLTMLKFISCYSDGYLLEPQCKGMDIVHVNTPGESPPPPPQSTDPPFFVNPENVTLTESEWPTSRITVELLAKSSTFRGYMLDARECHSCDSVGTFTVEDADNSILICSDRVVAQPNNVDKTLIRVFWTPKGAGTFFFRAAFVESYQRFWSRKSIPEPTTSTPAPTTVTVTPKPTIITAATSIDSHATVRPASPLQCVQYVRCVLALLLFSRLCFLGGSSLLMIKPVSKKTVTKSASVLELASKTIAAILILINEIQYECVYKCAGLQKVFTALTVTAMVSSLLHTITVFSHCGPSHELRKCWVGAIIMVDLMNTIITTTAIFFGIWCFEENWLAILMGVYVIWEIMLYLGSVCIEQMGKYQRRKKIQRNQNHTLERRISPWLIMFIIFTVFTVLFTVALMTGVSLVRIIN